VTTGPFVGSNLRLIRLFHDYSLTDLGERVGVSKQFLSRVETGAEAVSAALEDEFCAVLQVLPEFFRFVDPHPIADEQCHFRRQLTTKVSLRQVGRARGEMLKRLVGVLDQHVDLPPYRIEEAEPESPETIERSAEKFRSRFSLGMGPLSNVTRIAENAGAVVMHVGGLPNEIDAVSFATRRPVIALNAEGKSACRQRFGVAHEIGHLGLHIGVLTGDRLTESQANRFASALLMPRATFAAEFRRVLRGTRLNWSEMANTKRRWGVSKAALLYRGHQLGLLDESQLRSGYIFLKRHGEALVENEDASMPPEQPEVVSESLKVLREHYGMPQTAVAKQLQVKPVLLEDLLRQTPVEPCGNVVSLFSRSKASS
jgi:Zn-dependent peptidase ImmA (M78 family)/DNA-binding XRE family transcriptional regulator